MTTARRLLAALRTPLGVLALLACGTLLFLTLFAPAIWGERAAVTDTTQISQPPSDEHLFGTDGSGRDILLRTLAATQLSVSMALMATVAGVLSGVLVGLLPLILGGRAGRWIVAGINIGVAFPGLLLAIAFSVILGQSGTAATLAIAIAMLPNYGRLTHNLAASVWGRDYISAARVLGVPTWQIVLRHVLPNVRDPLLVNAAITAGGALVSFAGLSFLGLGIQVPQYDWGRMLNEGVSRIFVTPAAALVPGIAIILAGLTFVLLGEILGKALTPDTHRSLSSRVLRRLRAQTAENETEPAGVPAPFAEDSVLAVRNLRVCAPHGRDDVRTLVDGVSFDVARGEIVGVVGESGSGKSLTLMSMAGLLDPSLHVSADAARFDGEDLTLRAGGHPASLDHHFGKRMAMVFQDPMSSLNPALHVGSQVAEAGLLHLGMNRREAREAAIERLEAVRIPDAERRYGQYPHEYSGGMRQRAMIAAGLMGKPSLILADEPTTALDVTVQAEILTLLRRINEEDGTAIMFVSHDIAVVTSLCTRVLVMYRGRLVEDISSEDLRAGRAAHAYTRALMDTVPTMTTPRGEPMASIPDEADFSGGGDGCAAGRAAGVEVVRGDADAAMRGDAERLDGDVERTSDPLVQEEKR
ncbi:dipeptide/oligopeptide/nickel ABC transporter permease/ATP-binding protein [Sediminivirga luteola]|uniref:Peptide ABC transporter ATP-binding protein n=1 Tax=Sediminivirga luteola TaxID=1774748 RepID=A0A8J2XKT2_9MICO|nr:dipeptide/oligopeptide/nickel ABC transporter permease/ATP-binding protein [Sediminivirga luteola]MCI2264784.1 dipeptide/oligopeptide/nickel ABC transporter permease/ATP-binding protein [Sediminivirga luteola]GGA16462.1 peptide ABC transporter ATP-binding protein [Sediminivirga luteola]